VTLVVPRAQQRRGEEQHEDKAMMRRAKAHD
jgi:hypothetical protein